MNDILVVFYALAIFVPLCVGVVFMALIVKDASRIDMIPGVRPTAPFPPPPKGNNS